MRAAVTAAAASLASLVLATILAPTTAIADLVYYMPFDDAAGGASLANQGTAGGTGTAVNGAYGGPTPGAPTNTQIAPNLGSSYSQYLYASNSQYGGIVLPDSADKFRLDTAAGRMTISTWLYWEGPRASGTEQGIANNTSRLVHDDRGNGWSFGITANGELRFSGARKSDDGDSIENPRIFTTTSSVIPAASGWIHIAVEWDSSKTFGDACTLYVNGTAVTATASHSWDTAPALLPGNNTSPVILGNRAQQATNGGGESPLQGYLDDYAMWDTLLSPAQLRSIATAPSVIPGYNAGVMNGLFTAWAAHTTSVVGSLTWTYATGFDVTGKTPGDTWRDASGNYYLWLEGAGASATGLMAGATIPEPGTTAAMLGGFCALLTAILLRRRQ
jgi:hypothetical protein